MKNRGKGMLGLLLLFAAVIGFGYLAYTSMNQIKLGLDLAGGVSITYQTVEENPSDQDMADTIDKLHRRVELYSTEAVVYREGKNRINIDIPGVSDANAILEELGKPGSLTFTSPTGEVLLTGADVRTAKAMVGQDKMGQQEYSVELTFTDEGSVKFAEATKKYLNQKIIIMYDGQVESAPVVKQEITGGQAYIDGQEDSEAAEKLASTIRIGSLSLELTELRSNVVGAKLGHEAISTSLKAGAIGFALLVVFMIVIFLLPGFASIIGLALYVALMICLLAAFRITLTLPGIAGIILSVGMAVDANVIIFTRIKEELGHGKTVSAAIKEGFSKALSAIIDGNITTLIAAAVLYVKGSGPVKGFASTLALGIVLSMFTAIFVIKWAILAMYAMGADSAKLYGKHKGFKVYNYLSKKNMYFILSALVICVGFVGMAINNSSIGDIFNYGIDFKGGTSTNVTFNEDFSLADISSKIVPVVESVTGEAGTQTQKVKGSNEVIIKTRTLTRDEREALNTALTQNFGVDAEKITAESISATVSTEMKKDAIIATTIATLLMLIYIWVRFKDINFAFSSVIALVHDVLVIIAIYALAKWSVGSTFIACILTIVGYSINATIVIFDRIRENLAVMPSKTAKLEIVNTSISQTLTRSIYTSLTTFIMISILYIMGVSSIKEFALPIMAGIAVGTYSSICLAGAMWYQLGSWQEKKRAKAREEQRARKKGKK